jgi:hypothetical protein
VHRVDKGLEPGLTSAEKAELTARKVLAFVDRH